MKFDIFSLIKIVLMLLVLAFSIAFFVHAESVGVFEITNPSILELGFFAAGFASVPLLACCIFLPAEIVFFVQSLKKKE